MAVYDIESNRKLYRSGRLSYDPAHRTNFSMAERTFSACPIRAVKMVEFSSIFSIDAWV